jgi:hypothetical protein
MKVIFKIMVLLLVLNTSNYIYSQNLDNLKNMFNNYFNAIKANDFLESSKFIYPKDLETLKNVLFPIIVQLTESKIKEKKDIAYAIIGNDKEKWNEITNEIFYASFVKYAMDSNIEIKNMFSNVNFEISEIIQNNKEEAVIEYFVIFEGKKYNDNENVILYEDKWFFRMKQDPTLLEEQFKKLL